MWSYLIHYSLHNRRLSNKKARCEHLLSARATSARATRVPQYRAPYSTLASATHATHPQTEGLVKAALYLNQDLPLKV